MGPARYAPIPPAADHLHSPTLSPFHFPFPSPAASPSSTSITPTPTNPALTTPWPSLMSAAIPLDLGPTAAVPESLHPTDMPTILTPPIHRAEPDMNTLVGGALVPVLPIATTPARPLARSNPGLQLPSFKALGIAAPRPGGVESRRRVNDDLGNQAVGSGRMGRMSLGGGGSLTFSLGCHAAIFDDAELEHALGPYIPASGGNRESAAPRLARSVGSRSLDPLSRRATANGQSPNVKPVSRSRRGASQNLDRSAVDALHHSSLEGQSPTIHRMSESPAQAAVARPDSPCGPECSLPLHPNNTSIAQASHTLIRKNIHNIHDIHVLPLTPPQVSTDHKWPSIELHPQTTQPDLDDNVLSKGPFTRASSGLEEDLASIALGAPAGESLQSTRDVPHSATVPVFNSEESDWDFVDEIAQTLSSTVMPLSAAEPSNVSCQTLPSPLSGNRHSPLYTKILGELQAGTPRNNGAAIRVWYLLRKGVPCGDGPVSPPATPRSVSTAEEDYFTPKVYDFLARTPDYQNDHPALRGTPNNVLPLASINISVVERYIPPTNLYESRQLFDTQGLSTLVDRLTELSPNNGCMIFIYPTKTGGQTFMHQYLDPVLGPILRSTMVVNNLSADLSTSIGTMAAVNELDEYESLRYQMHDLCGRLSHANAAAQRFHGVKARFEVIYQSVQTVKLDRDTWTDWWTRQEKTRVRDVVTRHLHAALSGKRPLNDYGQRLPHATELSQQIMTAVESRMYPHGAEPVDGVEVGVFIVQRSA